ncbi:hypothetical protein G9A89_010590 [Geosiphon pyriformis]|nr:hypothetical protein G9A89_010590 [Geosiphon pyriformis]
MSDTNLDINSAISDRRIKFGFEAGQQSFEVLKLKSLGSAIFLCRKLFDSQKKNSLLAMFTLSGSFVTHSRIFWLLAGFILRYFITVIKSKENPFLDTWKNQSLSNKNEIIYSQISYHQSLLFKRNFLNELNKETSTISVASSTGDIDTNDPIVTQKRLVKDIAIIEWLEMMARWANVPYCLAKEKWNGMGLDFPDEEYDRLKFPLNEEPDVQWKFIAQWNSIVSKEFVITAREKIRLLSKEIKAAKVIVLLTGHGIGGIYAAYLGTHLVSADSRKYFDALGKTFKFHITTYGQPRVGNFAAVKFFSQLQNEKKLKIYRVTHANEHAPHYPTFKPKKARYWNIEREYWITDMNCDCIENDSGTSFQLYDCPGSTPTKPFGESTECSLSTDGLGVAAHKGPYFNTIFAPIEFQALLHQTSINEHQASMNRTLFFPHFTHHSSLVFKRNFTESEQFLISTSKGFGSAGPEPPKKKLVTNWSLIHFLSLMSGWANVPYCFDKEKWKGLELDFPNVTGPDIKKNEWGPHKFQDDIPQRHRQWKWSPEWRAAVITWPVINAAKAKIELLSQQLDDEKVNLYFVGHGVGGIYAAYLAVVLAQLREQNDIIMLMKRFKIFVITYGQPRFGNNAAVKIVNRFIDEKALRIYRVTHANDYFPHHPSPKIVNKISNRYWHTEREYWIPDSACDCSDGKVDKNYKLFDCAGFHEKDPNGYGENKQCNLGTDGSGESAHYGPYFGTTFGDCQKFGFTKES